MYVRTGTACTVPMHIHILSRMQEGTSRNNQNHIPTGSVMRGKCLLVASQRAKHADTELYIGEICELPLFKVVDGCSVHSRPLLICQHESEELGLPIRSIGAHTDIVGEAELHGTAESPSDTKPLDAVFSTQTVTQECTQAILSPKHTHTHTPAQMYTHRQTTFHRHNTTH